MFRRELLKKFWDRKVLVIGDFMLDEYIEGKVERISPEAPVPIVEARETTFRPGGAANVAVNVRSLGGSVTVLGVVGNDEGGERLRKILSGKGINTELLLEDTSRPTTRKTRIISGSQQLLRVDWESKNYISEKLRKELLTYLLENYRDFDVIVISDYGKGVVTKELFEITGEIRRKTPVFLDPKERNFPIYRNVTAMTPNIKETFQAVGIKPISDEDAERAGKKLIERFNLEYAVVTRSERGISIVTGKEVKHIPTRAKQVFDVTGAGDTVIASFSLAVAAGALPFEAGEIANLAAGIVVGKLGTATVTVEEIEEALNALQNL
ncbi:rfaE bifunctional protein, domain I [Balnearium lithotrophicum]|uniref:RfaE bifunctional protein, domain I n=1 Tax=Balnearium lithotrophicum TaxID=223788 RepID=A0A521BJJ9_9BACT|nr:D-glycero-beta-D-manno-heptose-7-phosphate kinase [Balnearium lithotrophicum]SMO47263.1 rfaE bifunctional protein, domain I [Balnearium lithotrophicum]